MADGLTQEDFAELSACIEVAHKVNAQKLNMVQTAQLAMNLNQLREKVKALVVPGKEQQAAKPAKKE